MALTRQFTRLVIIDDLMPVMTDDLRKAMYACSERWSKDLNTLVYNDRRREEAVQHHCGDLGSQGSSSSEVLGGDCL